MQSERGEDIQFGTVSEILTVSSSVQIESATHGEAASSKVGVSLDEILVTTSNRLKLKRLIANQERLQTKLLLTTSFNYWQKKKAFK